MFRLRTSENRMLVFRTVELCMVGIITGEKWHVNSHNWQNSRVSCYTWWNSHINAQNWENLYVQIKT